MKNSKNHPIMYLFKDLLACSIVEIAAIERAVRHNAAIHPQLRHLVHHHVHVDHWLDFGQQVGPRGAIVKEHRADDLEECNGRAVKGRRLHARGELCRRPHIRPGFEKVTNKAQHHIDLKVCVGRVERRQKLRDRIEHITQIGALKARVLAT